MTFNKVAPLTTELIDFLLKSKLSIVVTWEGYNSEDIEHKHHTVKTTIIKQRTCEFDIATGMNNLNILGNGNVTLDSDLLTKSLIKLVLL